MKLSRQELYNKLWISGTKNVQEKLGLTYTELINLCKQHNIPRPTSAYWVAKHLGKPAEQTDLPPTSGEVDMVIDTDLYKKENQKHTKSKTPSVDQSNNKSSDTTTWSAIQVLPFDEDPIIIDTIAKHREKVFAEEHSWNVKNPYKCQAVNYLDMDVSKNTFDRALRVFYSIICAAKRHGYDIDTKHTINRYNQTKESTCFIVKGERIAVEMKEGNRQVISQEGSYPSHTLVPNGELKFRISGIWHSDYKEFKDTKFTTLESKIDDIIDTLSTTADKRIEYARQQKIEEEQRRIEAEQKRREEEEQRRLDALRAEERTKVTSWLVNVERYAVAEQMNAYIQTYKRTLTELGIENSGKIEERLLWMQAKADWMNPFINKSDDLLTEDDFYKILHPKEAQTSNNSYFRSEYIEPRYNFWQLKHMYGHNK